MKVTLPCLPSFHVYAGNPDKKLEAMQGNLAQAEGGGPRKVFPGIYAGGKSRANALRKDLKELEQQKMDAVPEKLSSWTCVGVKPGGTAAGALYTDTHGQKWLVKGYGNDDMAKSEVLTSHLLNAVGAHTAEMKLVDLGNEHKGGFGVASRWLDNAQPFNARDEAHVKSMQQGFAGHAWLANWDSVGLTHDNVVIQDGKAVHIDPGGALEYRAMGGKKGDKFAGKVGELDTMRNPNMNQASAAVYGTMTQEEVASSAEAVLDLPAATIAELVGRYGPGSTEHRTALTAKLIERQQDIKKWCGAA